VRSTVTAPADSMLRRIAPERPGEAPRAGEAPPDVSAEERPRDPDEPAPSRVGRIPTYGVPAANGASELGYDSLNRKRKKPKFYPGQAKPKPPVGPGSAPPPLVTPVVSGRARIAPPPSDLANKMPLPPAAELQWWYQYYFATERGRAGYEKYRRDFAKLIWRTASPRWEFDDATFERSAAAFDNPDHVSISIHNYRWRLGLAEGEAKYDELEKRLAAFPVIAVSTVTLEGDANGAPHPEPAAYAGKFSGKYAHRLVTGGIGHNLPQEAPEAFARAVLDLARG